MPEYIEREALIKKLEDKITNPTNAFINNVLIGLLEKAPAADVVEVVRCKDCEYLMFSDCYGECKCGNMGIVSPDGFCSKGKRKEVANSG